MCLLWYVSLFEIGMYALMRISSMETGSPVDYQVAFITGVSQGTNTIIGPVLTTKRWVRYRLYGGKVFFMDKVQYVKIPSKYDHADICI